MVVSFINRIYKTRIAIRAWWYQLSAGHIRHVSQVRYGLHLKKCARGYIWLWFGKGDVFYSSAAGWLHWHWSNHTEYNQFSGASKAALQIHGQTRMGDCPACRTSLIATRFWVVVICPIIKCLTALEFSFILFDLCLSITIFNFILNYVPIVTFWIFTYHKIWILLIIFCFIWNYWIIYFSTCLEVFWSVVS